MCARAAGRGSSRCRSCSKRRPRRSRRWGTSSAGSRRTPPPGARSRSCGASSTASARRRPGSGRRPPAPPHRRRKKKTGFFAGLFQGLEDFADNVAHAAHAGAGILGKAMHYAEMGMHGLNVVEHAAEKVQGFAGKAEGFLHQIHLDGAADLAHKIGDTAGWVDDKSKQAHEGLQTADQYLGEGKKDLGKVESFSHKASHALKGAEHGKFGELVSLFRAAKSGDGLDGKP